MCDIYLCIVLQAIMSMPNIHSAVCFAQYTNASTIEQLLQLLPVVLHKLVCFQVVQCMSFALQAGVTTRSSTTITRMTVNPT
jgi:hypothetical protein